MVYDAYTIKCNLVKLDVIRFWNASRKAQWTLCHSEEHGMIIMYGDLLFYGEKILRKIRKYFYGDLISSSYSYSKEEQLNEMLTIYFYFYFDTVYRTWSDK
jgi:hypothetical protein